MPDPKAVEEAKDKIAEIRKKQGLSTEGTVEDKKTLAAPIKEGAKPSGEGEPIIIGDLPREAIPVTGEVIDPKVKPTGETDHAQEYKVLQGKYDKEVPRLNDQIRNFEETLANSQATIANLNELVLNLSKPAGDGEAIIDPNAGGDGRVVDPKKPTPKLNPEDFAGYGSEMMDVIDTLNTVVAENDALRATNVELKTSMTDVTNKTEDVFKTYAVDASTKFYTNLANAVPEWETVNGEQWWKEWLGGLDELSGYRRQDLLDSAQKDSDSSRVIKIFKQAMADTGHKNNGAVKRPVQGNLDDQLVPERTTGSTGSSVDSFVQVSKAELDQAGLDKIHKKITMDQYKDITQRFIKTNQQLQGV